MLSFGKKCAVILQFQNKICKALIMDYILTKFGG